MLEIEKISEKKEKQQKLLVILCLLVSMCIQGVATVLVDDSHKLQSFVEQSIGPILIATCIAWCTVDARAKGEILNFGWIFGMFLLAPIIFPTYLIKKRGFKSGLILTIKSVGIVFVATILSVTCSEITNLVSKT